MFMQIDWSKIITAENIGVAIRVVIIIGIGLPLLRIVAKIITKTSGKHLSIHTLMLIRKAVYYFGIVIILIMVLHQLGFQLAALLGAAGIAGVAIGFASQTSLSNLISGLFLISEKPFSVGDVIQVGNTTGIVMSIDLLSVKIRKFDNLYVRIPNETLIKSELTNITRYPIRRFDLKLGVAYKEDIKRVRELLLDIARLNPYCLDEPEPIVLLTNFGDSAVEILFAVWFSKTDFLVLRNSIMEQIKERFDAEGIEIPFPHRTIYAGSVTEPFPVRVVDSVSDKKED